MNVMSAEEQGKLERLANYLAYGVPQRQAAAAVGFSDARVSLLLQQEDFQALVREKMETIAARLVDTNSLYEQIEAVALKNVLDVIRIDADPDVNMRAALMANRANRRPVNGNAGGVLDAAAANGGKMATISLSFNIQQKIMTGALKLEEKQSPKTIDESGKDVNMATPAMVDSLLTQFKLTIGEAEKASRGIPAVAHGQAMIRSLEELLVPIDG